MYCVWVCGWLRYPLTQAPQVQLPAEGRLKAALQEVLHPSVLLLLVQQRLGCQLVAAVVLVGVKPGQLRDEEGHFY